MIVLEFDSNIDKREEEVQLNQDVLQQYQEFLFVLLVVLVVYLVEKKQNMLEKVLDNHQEW